MFNIFVSLPVFLFFFVFFCFVYLLVDKINNHTILRKEQLPFERKLFVN